MAGPLMAPITGWGSLRIWGTMSPKYSMARMASRDRVRPSAWGGTPASSRSRPEQKPSPLPVRITTQQSLSRPAASRASRSGMIVSKDMAFIRSGRFSVICRTCGRGSVTST